MINFDDVIARIKKILLEQKKTKKILDKDIASALQLTPQYYAVIKKRKKIPYESIAYFSQSHKLNMTWLLLNQKPLYLT